MPDSAHSCRSAINNIFPPCPILSAHFAERVGFTTLHPRQPSNKRVRDLEITRERFERRDLSLCLLEKAG